MQINDDDDLSDVLGGVQLRGSKQATQATQATASPKPTPVGSRVKEVPSSPPAPTDDPPPAPQVPAPAVDQKTPALKAGPERRSRKHYYILQLNQQYLDAIMYETKRADGTRYSSASDYLDELITRDRLQQEQAGVKWGPSS